MDCKKSNDEQLSNYAYDFTTILSSYLDVYTLVNQYDILAHNFSDTAFFCKEFSITRLNGKTTLNFGNNCLCEDGIPRKGTITLLYDSVASDKIPLVAKIENYEVNNQYLNGEISMLISSDGSLIEIKETDGTCEDPDGLIWFNEKGRLTIKSGKETVKFIDDIFTYETESNVRSKNNESFSVVTSKALTKKKSCEWITKGELIIRNEKDANQLLDFGDDRCDDEASLKIDDDIFIFILN